jgi:hypothetical protein
LDDGDDVCVLAVRRALASKVATPAK